MKKFILLLPFVISSLSCLAQTPNWIWGEAESSAGGYYYIDTHGIAAGSSGALYIGGRFGGTMTLNGATATATASSSEIFSAKMDSAGYFHWIAPHPYTNENDYDYGFGIDSHENTYVTGQTQGSNGLFIDKYDSAGNKKWSFDPGALSSGIGGYGNIGVDNSGNVYATGSFGQSSNFGPVTLNPVGNNDIFLVKLDSNGNCKWAVRAGGSGVTDGGRGVAVAPNGSVYVCGSYNGTTSFGSITLPTVSSDGFFIAKYDTSGNPVWVQYASNAGFQSGAFYWQFNAITVDSCSNVYVTGHYVNTAQFGPFTLNNSNGNYNVFVAKCMANGKWEWAEGDGGTGNDEGFGIALDKYSDVYVSGYFEGSAQFAGQTVTTSAPSEVFVAKYANSNGALQWVAPGGGTLNTSGQSLALDKQGYVYIVGGIGTGSDAVFGASNIGGNSSSGQNIFLAKLDTVPHRTITPIVSTTYCPGETVPLPYSVTGTFNSANTFTAQLSNDSGSFVNAVDLGSINYDTSGIITITIPANTPPGSDYLIRVVSDSPSTSSWANGCGAYYINNVYVNDFYVTIGNNLSVSVLNNTDTICSGGTVLLTAIGDTNAAYKWTSGTDTSALAKTDTFTVSPVSTTTYYINVGNGYCSGTDSVVVTVTPVSPLVIQPPSPESVCLGSGITLTVPVSGSDYSWSPSSTLNTSTGDTVIATPLVQTTYTATGLDSLGCAVSGIEVIDISPTPGKPTISQIGNVLTSSATQGNQWVLNDTTIQGATNQTYTATTSGWYQVIAENPANGCNATSDSVLVTVGGINRLSFNDNQLSIYPNPTNGEIYININSSVENVKDWTLQITDVLGRTIYARSSLSYSNAIDLSNLPGGVYFITIINNTVRGVFPVVKQN